MDNNAPSQVSIIDVRMPFWSMVVFLVKLVIASIPAMFILAIIGTVISVLVAGVVGVALS